VLAETVTDSDNTKQYNTFEYGSALTMESVHRMLLDVKSRNSKSGTARVNANKLWL
jgi:hypothetical protein